MLTADLERCARQKPRCVELRKAAVLLCGEQKRNFRAGESHRITASLCEPIDDGATYVACRLSEHAAHKVAENHFVYSALI